MRFFINNIVSHTAKCNLITFQIVETGTIIDGCEVQAYAPKSYEFQTGVINEVPFFVAKGIFGFNRPKNIKSLERQLQAKAPKGQKRDWRAQAPELFENLSKLNIEVPEETKEPEGCFIGKVGEKVTFIVDELILVHAHDWTSDSGWRHNGHGWERPSGTRCMWKFIDGAGQEYMFSTSGNVTNGKLDNLNKGTFIEAVVDAHSVFRNKRQTWIRNLKFNTGLFSLLS